MHFTMIRVHQAKNNTAEAWNDLQFAQGTLERTPKFLMNNVKSNKCHDALLFNVNMDRIHVHVMHINFNSHINHHFSSFRAWQPHSTGTTRQGIFFIASN